MTFETFDQSDDLTKNTRNCIFKSALYESAFFENALPDLKSGLGIAFSKLCEFIPQSECCVFYLFLSGLIVGVQHWYNMHIKGPCTGCFFNWYPPKKLKYGKPRLGESTLT